MEEFIEKYSIDLSSSYAYGDTSGDLTMFQSVRYPVCVNPTKELIQKVMQQDCLKDKLEVVIERKDVVYMDKYINDNKIDLCKLKILIIINELRDFDENKLLEYISKYKFVDVLKTKNINKYDSSKLQKFIKNINNEYGTTIELIGKRNIQKYNIYLMYSKMDRNIFIQQYILNSKSLYLDMNDIDMDIMSEEYICYKRYEPEILTILNRLEINRNNFSKVKLGFLFK